MGLFSKLFRKKREYEPLEEIPVDLELQDGESFNLDDSEQRFSYVKSCLEQIGEASGEIERLKSEYQMVNSYLHDMEEIEALPEVEKKQVEEHAQAIFLLNGNKERAKERTVHMSESDYRKIERLEDEVEDGIKKIAGTEDYQNKIRKDMQRLEGEKHACLYRMEEAKAGQMNMRGITIISLIAAAACVVILLILQFMLEMDTQIGYMILTIGTAVLLTVFFVKFNEAKQELAVASKSCNKVIALQNKVKIRYVNNCQLMEYLYLKYNTDSAAKLEKRWKLYQDEKEERKQFAEAEAKMEYYQKQLVEQLSNYRVQMPERWISQTAALLDKREMVEIRHELIQRRQALRKQMDYNQEVAESARNEVKEVAALYPKYAQEILSMVERYDR